LKWVTWSLDTDSLQELTFHEDVATDKKFKDTLAMIHSTSKKDMEWALQRALQEGVDHTKAKLYFDWLERKSV